MVLTAHSTMSRTDEVHRITENVYKSIMEQFNPCLRNFLSMGKTTKRPCRVSPSQRRATSALWCGWGAGQRESRLERSR
ncbi:hypothetical protein AAFF_G00317450 [Aldrovandia affinis]|uniref:Uncharacterized protein n=1 Tax=Aldrovandia affinis TaxID=143900 RepID=A0AAD7R7F3_9TELE|nr:hypothetical protein AAFF_G00317450 [Aldrovandia affinis]